MEITPNQFKIFADFKHLVGCVNEAVILLDEALKPGTSAAASFAQIQKVEHEGDEIVRRALRQLDRQLTDVVPREDTFRTFARLDEIIDTVEGLAGRLNAFALPSLPDGAFRLMAMIHSANRLLGEMIEMYGAGHRFGDLVARMGDLENEADDVFQCALATLFQTTTDPVLLIKHNEVYGFLDRIVDQFEDCGKALEDAALKDF